MKLNAADRLHLNIANYQFLLNPIQISVAEKASSSSTAHKRFPKINRTCNYIAQIQKGAQLIKRLKTTISFNTALKCCFNEPESIKLKIFSQKFSNFSVGINRQESQMLQFIDSVPIQVQKAFQNYTQEINQKNKEYASILQKIQRKQQFGTDWKHFKDNCTQHHQTMISHSQNKTIELKYSLLIRSQIDALADKEQPKAKIKTKQSLRSHESDKRSSSSIFSQSKNKEQNSHSDIEKSFNRCHSQAKTQLEQKPQTAAKTQPIKEFMYISQAQNMLINQETKVQPSEASYSPQIQKEPIIIPIQSIIKKNENLSDILEASYEGDSGINSVGDKTDRKCKEMPQINQEEEVIILESRTYHYLKDQDSPVSVRRNNSLNHIGRNHSKFQDSTQNGLQDQDFEDQQLTQSVFHTQPNQPSTTAVEKGRKLEKTTFLLLLILSLVIVGVTFVFLTEHRQLYRKTNCSNQKYMKIEKKSLNLMKIRTF